MRWTTITLAAAAAAASAAVAIAAPSAVDPLRLALQRSDVPPAASGPNPSRLSAANLRILGVRGLRGAEYSYRWPAGGDVDTPAGPLPKEWYLSGSIYVAPDRASARRLFTLGKRAQIGFFSDFPGQPNRLVRVTLPRYGDEQFGLFASVPAGTGAMVFVRKGTVVWGLRVGSAPLRWRPTRAQMLTVLRTYASKQRARVGAG